MATTDRLLILFAGETGNSEDVARIIYRRAKEKGFVVSARSINDYRTGSLVEEKCVLFVCSTTGQGNEPVCLRPFWTFIMRKGLPPDCLANINAAVIGLGDSSYIKYNVVGKKLFRRLKSLGAKMILDLALGDDQHDLGLWASVDPWLNDFWPKVSELLPFKFNPDSNMDEPSLVGPSYELTILNSIDTMDIREPARKESYGTVSENERITPKDHFQEVRFIKINLESQKNLTHSPGDVALVFPENFPEEVDNFIKLLNLAPSMFVACKRVDHDFSELNENKLPERIGVHSLVTKHLDIHSVPKRAFFDLLWRFSTDDLERQKLKEFASTEGQQDLYNYCIRPKRTILEVLQDFPRTSSAIPLNYLLDLIPCIRPRAFSIASSLAMFPNELHLLVAVVQYRTKIRAPRLGLCSNYLSRIGQGNKIRLTIRSGDFKIPENDPLIMIGPGTGVAPFRSIIQQRYILKIPDNVLFFGCRFKEADFYFADEWKTYQANGHLQLFTAFSRENPTKKYYVQDEMLIRQSTLIDFIFNKRTTILIAGSSNQMPDDVRNCIKTIIGNHLTKMSPEAVENLICKLESSRKIQYECWS